MKKNKSTQQVRMGNKVKALFSTKTILSMLSICILTPVLGIVLKPDLAEKRSSQTEARYLLPNEHLNIRTGSLCQSPDVIF